MTIDEHAQGDVGGQAFACNGQTAAAAAAAARKTTPARSSISGML